MKFLVFALWAAAAFAEAPPADVRCEKPESVVVTHVPRARTSCSWKHEGEEPADFRFEATLPSGLVTVQEGIVGKSTEVDLQCFQNYGIIVYARYVRPNGTEYLASSKEIAVSSGECAPPEIVWFDHQANATAIALEWGLASMIYLNSTTGYNLTLVPDDHKLKTINIITPPVLTYEARGLTPETTYVAKLFPFFKTKKGAVLKPRETIFKFKTRPLFSQIKRN